MTQPIDSLIFDMDGTLWDATDSYCRVWDTTCARLGISRAPVQYHELVGLMGKPLTEIFDCLVGGLAPDKQLFMDTLAEVEDSLMPRLGGRLYPGVTDTLAELHRRGVKLFMISNCTGTGLDNFLNFTRLRPLMTDWLSYGATGVDKDVNLRHLTLKHSLKRPVYVGDIQRDSDSTHAAGLEFAHAAYGFGQVCDADFTLNRFPDLLSLPI